MGISTCWESEGVSCFLNTQRVLSGADFGGKTKATWTSGANSVTGSTTAATISAAIRDGSVPSWATGMFGKYLIADPRCARELIMNNFV
jgi:hypothetical protein